MLSRMDLYLFGQGTHYEIYKKLGAHPLNEDGSAGFSFAVWAPHASSVSVIGDFNRWKADRNPLKRLDDSGVFYGEVPEAREGQLYRFSICAADGRLLEKIDPYAFWAERRPGNASRLYVPHFSFTDHKWLKTRSGSDLRKGPLSIYEVHLASWIRDDENRFLNYRELAHRLADYVRSMGYTHVELIGISEYPLDASWGYQVTGYYAPTSRMGSPEDFKYFVNHLHEQGIGVILDWVPAHFPRDSFALAQFDGEPLYEHPDPHRGEQPDWGTLVFNWGHHEVSNFLLGSALYWVREFHIDGLRVDAVASMLYLDFGRSPGHWTPNPDGSRENREAVAFLKHFNSVVRGAGAITVAEESTAWPHITGNPDDPNSLGFTFKWNMGWMHDFLDYSGTDPLFRYYSHNRMTFGMTYIFNEDFVLVLSHDEVVHLKKSMWEKMPGSEGDKYRALKAAYAFMIGHPGKKLLFMGQEFGQRREWCEDRPIDWFLLEDKRNRDLKNFFSQLLMLYRKYSALSSDDLAYRGFDWINCNDAARSIFSFIRWDAERRHPILFSINMTPVPHPDYRVGVPLPGSWTRLLEESGNPEAEGYHLKAQQGECDSQPYSLSFPLCGYGVGIYRLARNLPNRKKNTTEK